MKHVDEANKIENTNDVKKGDLLIEKIDEDFLLLLIVQKVVSDKLIEVKYSCFNYQENKMFFRIQTINVNEKDIYKFKMIIE